MDFQFMWQIFPSLLRTLPITIYIFVVSAVLSLILSVIIAIVRINKVPVISHILSVYTSFMRSTPGIIHIFIVYYGLPALLLLFGININAISRVTFSVVALVLYNSAFVSEIIRPAYMAIPQSQHDAANSIGMTSRQRITRIILPQLVPIAIPGVGNAMIDLLKDTSLLFIIGLVDIMGQAEIIIANTYGVYQLEVYVVIALIYWALTAILSKLIDVLEQKTINYIR